MPEFEHSAHMIVDACLADDREQAEPLIFDLDLKLARLGHMPPDVFEVVLDLLRRLDPRRSSTYVLLVNLLQQNWSKLTAFQRQQTLDSLMPHTEDLEFFEAQQAILELCNGKYLG